MSEAAFGRIRKTLCTMLIWLIILLIVSYFTSDKFIWLLLFVPVVTITIGILIADTEEIES